jgi:hypothetical protein
MKNFPSYQGGKRKGKKRKKKENKGGRERKDKKT